MAGAALRTPVYLLLSLLPYLASAKDTYYIRPTLDSPCPYDDCLTLSQYGGQNRSYSSLDNLTLVFLPGEHVVHNVTIFNGNLHSLRLLGNGSLFPNFTSKIKCDQSPAFVMVDVPMVEIRALAFESCGKIASNSSSHWKLPLSLEVTGYVVPAVSAVLVGRLELAACSMKQSKLPLFIYRSISLLQDNQFENNTGAMYGGALLVKNSTVIFEGHCLFERNNALLSGGGIFADSSELIFKGRVAFVGNSAEDEGGGIGAFNSSIEFERTPPTFVSPTHSPCADSYHLFAENEANFGGGMALVNSTIRQTEGVLELTGNLAYYDGGGAWYRWTLAVFDSATLFYNNTAFEGGGAVVLWHSHLNSSTISMSNNTAVYGGALVSVESSVSLGINLTENVLRDCIGLQKEWIALCEYDDAAYHHGEYDIMIAHNLATIGGGAFVTENTTLEVIGNSCFERNSATENTSTGGGICAVHSVLLFWAQTVFHRNSASAGGALMLNHSEAYLSGESIFVRNEGLEGAGIAAFSTNLSLGSHSKFLSNLATIGGGILATKSELFFYGKSEFINNSAVANGGGIYTWQHNILFFYSQSIFINNSAEGGGGIASDADNITRSIVVFNGPTIFTNNVAEAGGGVVGFGSDIDFFDKYVFTGNEGGYHGGGIFLIASTLVFDKSGTFSDNAAAAGGALSLISSTITLQGSGIKLQRNSALYGGAILARSCKLQLVGEFNFGNNQATHGGAIFVYDGSDLSISGRSAFHNNAASLRSNSGFGGYGGGIIALSSRVTFRGQIYFENNYAFYGGAMEIAQHNQNYKLFIEPNTSVYFLGNHALKHGGAIMVEDLVFNYCGYDSIANGMEEMCMLLPSL